MCTEYGKTKAKCLKDTRCEDRQLDRCHPATPIGGGQYDTAQSQFYDGGKHGQSLVCDRTVINLAYKKKAFRGGLPGPNQCVVMKTSLLNKNKYSITAQRCDVKVNGCYRACDADTCNALPGCQAIQQSLDPNEFYCQPILYDPNSPRGPYANVRPSTTWGFSAGTPMIKFECESFNNGCSGGWVIDGQYYYGSVFSSPGLYNVGFNLITNNFNALIMAFTTVEFWLFRSPKDAGNFSPYSLLRTVLPNEVCNVQSECCTKFRTFRVPVSISDDVYDYKVVLKATAPWGGGVVVNPANPLY
jgi:hypothetical protein